MEFKPCDKPAIQRAVCREEILPVCEHHGNLVWNFCRATNAPVAMSSPGIGTICGMGELSEKTMRLCLVAFNQGAITQKKIHLVPVRCKRYARFVFENGKTEFYACRYHSKRIDQLLGMQHSFAVHDVPLDSVTSKLECCCGDLEW